MPTLEDVLATGRGRERSFNCHVHDDGNASASVNAETGLWLCYACGARGRAGVPAPTTRQLADMLAETEYTPRVYPPSYLGAFTAGPQDYWVGRVGSRTVVEGYGLGTHPVTGKPTFPVYDFLGRLRGCGERTDRPGMKYSYPKGFRASMSFGRATPASARAWKVDVYPETVVLVEGVADAARVTASGTPGALACWGCSLHRPQAEQLLNRGVRRLLVGFDMDAAGERGYDTLLAAYRTTFDVVRVTWPSHDPGETSLKDVRAAVKAVW